jgi:NAD(P)-dependent dehydrogenase (short-subunit alcohol dehydrogenase family)
MLVRHLLGYQTSKTTLCRFTEFLAKEYEAQGLVAIAVHPGDVFTDMATSWGKGSKALFKDTPELAGNTMAVSISY